MAAALTPPLLVAAGVLAVAGAFKLRNPAPALTALAILRLPVRAGLIRGLGMAEIALGLWCASGLGRLAALLVACLFAGFALVALRLARVNASCGCFGANETPASLAQVALSAGVAIAALTAALSGAHGVGWVLQRPPGSGMLLALGTAGAVYAAVSAYTLLPQAWSAWSGEWR